MSKARAERGDTKAEATEHEADKENNPNGGQVKKLARAHGPCRELGSAMRSRSRSTQAPLQRRTRGSSAIYQRRRAMWGACTHAAWLGERAVLRCGFT